MWGAVTQVLLPSAIEPGVRGDQAGFCEQRTQVPWVGVQFGEAQWSSFVAAGHVGAHSGHTETPGPDLEGVE